MNFKDDHNFTKCHLIFNRNSMIENVNSQNFFLGENANKIACVYREELIYSSWMQNPMWGKQWINLKLVLLPSLLAYSTNFLYDECKIYFFLTIFPSSLSLKCAIAEVAYLFRFKEGWENSLEKLFTWGDMRKIIYLRNI